MEEPCAATSKGSDQNCRPADVGVLFVHGIGDQDQGETLMAFAGPTFRWLKEFLEALRTSPASVATLEARTYLRPPADTSPSHFRFNITAPLWDGNPTIVTEEWLFAEAWWGKKLTQPKSNDVLVWLLSHGPLLVFWHFYVAAMALPNGSRGRHVRLCWSVLVALVTASAAWIGTLIVLILSFVPFGPWRSFLMALVRALTLSLGDCYQFIEQDVARDATLTSCRDDLDWLALQAKHVAVVAHSQGAAIAHELLRRRQGAQRRAPIAELDAFISVGSGLEKLKFLHHIKEAHVDVVSSALVPPLLVLSVGLSLIGVTLADRYFTLIGIVLAFGVAALGSHTFRLLSRCTNDLIRGEQSEEQGRLWRIEPSIIWTDLFASHDLVPTRRGAITKRLVDAIGGSAAASEHGLPRSVRILNRCSMTVDHTSYFSNRTHFQPWLCMCLAWRSRLLPPHVLGEIERLGRLLQSHSFHARCLQLSRWGVWIGALPGLVARHDAVERIGATCSRFARSLLSAIGFAPDWFVADPSVRHLTIGYALCIAILIVYLLIVQFLWGRVTDRLWDRYWRSRGGFGTYSPGIALAVALTITSVVVLAPVLAEFRLLAP